MIEKVEFRNFKALRDVLVPLSPFTLIVGPNASGKTSVLEGLHYLSRLGTEPPQQVFQGPSEPARLRTSGIQGTMSLALAGKWENDAGFISLEFDDLVPFEGPTDKNGWSFQLRGQWNGANEDLRIETGPYPRKDFRYASPNEPLLESIKSAALLHLDVKKLGEPSFSEEINPCVEIDGSNLAAALADMAIQTPERFAFLVARLKQIVPSVRGLRFQKTSVENDRLERVEGKGETLYRDVKVKAIAYQAVFDSVSGKDISAPYASEGTLLTLGLISVLCGPVTPSLVLIDELERGLHPKALAALVSQVREIQKQFPDLQVVATTHSPYLADHFPAHDVLLTALSENGSVSAARLSDHPDFEKWKDEMGAGEFWSTVGEDWVTKRNQSAHA